ncbi:carboxylesterase family protein [Streptacidiphilus anmyonensis]|uniref:carboxylesterase family protein n=1 Tax=Streptacidiphilus anmyonensis TaxID=405782 RepID=UPI000693A92A|nr:carboxylesterase family protein [Streptacidiphilus anmyonensis]
MRERRRNAAAFGGAPDNITLFDESSGAASIGCLMASPLAAGLFQRAILSGGHPEMVRPPAQAQALADGVAAALGVPATAEAFRDKTSEELIAVQGAGYGIDLRDEQGVEPFGGILPYTPVTGDDVLPEHPLAAIRNGAGSEIALIVGTNREEFNLTTVPNDAIDALDNNKAVATLSAIRPNAAEILALYGVNQPGTTAGQALTQAQTDLTFRLPARRVGAAHQGRTHFYEFGWRSPVLGGRLGACHGLILPFMFNTLSLDTGPDRKGARTRHKSLACSPGLDRLRHHRGSGLARIRPRPPVDVAGHPQHHSPRRRAVGQRRALRSHPGIESRLDVGLNYRCPFTNRQ